MKKMKFICTVLSISVLVAGCQQSTDYDGDVDPGMVAFEKNAKTVLAYLDAWQSENVDYSKFYAKDYETLGMAFGDTDTIHLEQMIEWNNRLFEMYDFKIVDGPVNLLPGVDLETKKMDGSVRHYSEWEITRSPTDSTEAKTGNLRMYHAYVFNEEGKITLDLTYGDFGGLLKYLYSEEE